jgi:all-trans-retinol 13,14-reductase
VVRRRHGPRKFPRDWLERVDYEYSASSFSLYLGVRGDLDLRAHGFGNWNVWHYPSLDINAAYDRQHQRDDLSDPWLFISTPTLCSPRAKTRHAPEGDNIMEVITTCGYVPFEERQARGLRDYTDRKNTIRDRMIDILEQHYVPDLRKHIDMRVAGTPTTNKRYLWAPRGNIYGSALTPMNVDASRLAATSPIDNLFFVGAASSFPSIGGTVGGAQRLFKELIGR